jgi:hypothetical protein
MLPDTGIHDVKKQRNAEYAKHINDPVLSSLNMEGIRLLFFRWGRYVKDRVFVPPLPRDLADLQARIIAAVKNISAPMLARVWQELEYRIDMCRVTRGAHIEHP